MTRSGYVMPDERWDRLERYGEARAGGWWHVRFDSRRFPSSSAYLADRARGILDYRYCIGAADGRRELEERALGGGHR